MMLVCFGVWVGWGVELGLSGFLDFPGGAGGKQRLDDYTDQVSFFERGAHKESSQKRSRGEPTISLWVGTPNPNLKHTPGASLKAA